MNQIERITLMENYLNEAIKTLKNFEASLKDYQAIQGKLHELAKYYQGEEWRKDFDDDNNGLLPPNLKRGVLSEDGIYNALSSNKELLADTLEVIAGILRADSF